MAKPETTQVSEQEIARAARIIRTGGLVAFPTETTYGLGVDPFSAAALERLFAVKQRSPDKAVPVLIGDQEQLVLLAHEIPPLYSSLMKTYWPGPLTLLFDCRKDLPEILTAGRGTIGVRISSHPVARRLLEAAGMPVTATSANISGKQAAMQASEVVDQFGDGIDMLLAHDQGMTGSCSTVVGLDSGELKLVRPGVIDFAEILRTVAGDLG